MQANQRTRVIPRRILAAQVATLASCGVLSVAANAHVGLIASHPADGAPVEAIPSAVRSTFSADLIDPAFVTVTAPDGSTVAVGNTEVVGATVRQPADSTGADEGVDTRAEHEASA